jgi:UDP-N-acetylglucosamine--N-acetylmuramyl-(pentapeptide) pyrophosphoryl-undecaprenol N-acetylglucosamine transferase
LMVAAGGTGGHLYPALAIAHAVKELSPLSSVEFVGTKGKIEANVVPRRGYGFKTIWISGFHRGARLQNLLFPMKVLAALVQSFLHIRSFRPQVVLGTGSYVSGPVLAAASMLGVPTVIHESNSIPGVTTRLLARYARKVFTAFAETSKWLPRCEHVELVGTPTRRELGSVSRGGARSKLKLKRAAKTVFVLGGSQGSAVLNQSVAACLDELLAAGVQLIWQTGELHYEGVRGKIGKRKIGWVGPFLEKVELAYAAADVAVCRAGAATIAELVATATPAILVPFARAAADHQTINAKSLEQAGAAVMISEAGLNNRLLPELLRLLKDERLRTQMSRASHSLAHSDAARTIAEQLLAIAS